MFESIRNWFRKRKVLKDAVETGRLALTRWCYDKFYVSDGGRYMKIGLLFVPYDQISRFDKMPRPPTTIPIESIVKEHKRMYSFLSVDVVTLRMMGYKGVKELYEEYHATHSQEIR